MGGTTRLAVSSCRWRRAPQQQWNPYDFAGYRPDRGSELALFALEAKHELRLSHHDGCLKALWQPIGFFIFPGHFERPKWQSVLEAMHTLADSLERRAA